jgi:hypothetical protein
VLVAAAVCPHPPLLVPEAMGARGMQADAQDTERPRAGAPLSPGLAGLALDGPGLSPDAAGPSQGSAVSTPDGAAQIDAQLRELRSACRAAVATLAAARPDLIVVVGAAASAAVYAETAAGSLRPFGVPFTTGAGEAVLPLPLTVGAWLVRQLPAGQQAAQPAGPQQWRLHLEAVGQSLPSAPCRRLGAALAGLAPRVAMLAMGDGPARRAAGVHGAPDPLADDYAVEAAAAVASADTERLARLDPAADAELMVSGRPAWQVLAGAAEDGQMRGQLTFAAAPLDVAYLVAVWQR